MEKSLMQSETNIKVEIEFCSDCDPNMSFLRLIETIVDNHAHLQAKITFRQQYVKSESFMPLERKPSGSIAAKILRDAADIVEGVRNTTHGSKERSFQVIADFWNVHLTGRKEGRDAPITPRDVAWMMNELKIARAIQGEMIPDHAVDAAGYAAIAGELIS